MPVAALETSFYKKKYSIVATAYSFFSLPAAYIGINRIFSLGISKFYHTWIIFHVKWVLKVCNALKNLFHKIWDITKFYVPQQRDLHCHLRSCWIETEERNASNPIRLLDPVFKLGLQFPIDISPWMHLFYYDGQAWQLCHHHIQLRKMNVIPLVNKPYVNEVNLTWQNL